MSLLEEAIAQIKPSLTLEQIKRHEVIRDEFERCTMKSTEWKPIGFIK